MRNKQVIPVIILIICGLPVLYYVQVFKSSTQNTHNKHSSNSDKFPLPILDSLPSLRKDEVKDDVVDVKLKPCECSRRLTRQGGSVNFSETTCSHSSFARGANQKVVSFSYYEKDKKLSIKRLKTGRTKDNIFLRGLQINIDLLPTLYPGNRTIKLMTFLTIFCRICVTSVPRHGSWRPSLVQTVLPGLSD